MKLKVPIEKKVMPEGEGYINSPCGCGPEGGCGCKIDDFNECLDEISQCEACFDEEKLAMVLYADEYLIITVLKHIKSHWENLDGWEQELFLRRAKAIIASLPEIMSVRKGDNEP